MALRERNKTASFLIPALLCLALGPIECAAAVGDLITTITGLQFKDLKIGDGPTPRPGQTCLVNFTGSLYQDGKRGREFENSLSSGKPHGFVIGRGKAIKAWDQGIASMKVGGKRTLIVPPDLAYGSEGLSGLVPSNAWVIYDVELLNCR